MRRWCFAKRLISRGRGWSMLAQRRIRRRKHEEQFSRAEMARWMHTSRAALDRLLDPEYDAATLSTLRKAALAVRHSSGLMTNLSSFNWS
jgi:hypothetical protein